MTDGRSGISEIPDDRWNKTLFYDPDPNVPRKGTTKWGGFVKDVSGFDADFFNISPREAESMDPQQRMLLHVVWEALEDAGIAPDRLAGSHTGVFVGTALTDYALYQKANRDADGVHSGTGMALSVVSNRVSHRLDLRGPSLSVDTACSSSLTATHLACRSIWDGESQMAIAGGVSVILDPSIHVTFSKANMMSPTGQCQTFDAGADGYVRGEGAGVIVIKPLNQAMADGDRVYAVIRATAVNQDGHTSTITVPSGEAQADMLREALDQAGLLSSDVGYVEAHGTGTPVGDPIEAHAIGSVFGPNREDDDPILVGSVKSAVGHMEPAAGIVGLIKAALCVYHGAIPANLHFNTPNPAIPFDDLNIAVPTETLEWDGATKPRIAAINSFGFGGTNACAIVAQPPAISTAPKTAATANDSAAETRKWVVPLSAASEDALKVTALNLSKHLKKLGDDAPEMRDIAATLGDRRAHLQHRLAVVAETVPELISRTMAFAKDRRPKGVAKDTPPVTVSGRRASENEVVFVFCGQGGQWWGMARDLMDKDPVFRAEVDRFDKVFAKLSGWSVIDELYRDEADSRVNLTLYTQPAIFAVQLGLVARWRAWGVEPAAVVGHSFGEVCAGYVSGALTLEDAALIIHHRSNLMGRLKDTGGIAAVGISADHARRTLRELAETKVEIAGVNSGSLINLAGETEPLQRVLDHLVEEDPELFFRTLNVDYAPHCFMQEVLHEDLLSTLAPIEPSDYDKPMYSTVTGRQLDETRLDNTYWWRNARQAVQFKPAIDAALKDGYRTFVEIGPHATLAGLVSACAAEAGESATVVTSLNRKQRDEDVLSAALGTLYVNGVQIDWAAAAGDDQRFVDLPGYPWELKRYWLDSQEVRDSLFELPVHPLLGKRTASPQPTWQSEIDSRTFPFLEDHKVQGATVYPGTGYLEIMLAAAQDLFGDGPVEIEDVEYVEAMVLPDQDSEAVQTVYDPDRRLIRIYSRAAGSDHAWTLRAKGCISQRPLPTPRLEGWSAPRNGQDAKKTISKASVYRAAEALGLGFGPAFRGIRSIEPNHPNYIGEISVPKKIAKEIAKYRFHPALFDACLQVGFGAVLSEEVQADREEQSGGVSFLPTKVARIRFHKQPSGKLRSRTKFLSVSRQDSVADTEVIDADGAVIATIEGVTSERVDSGGRQTEEDGAQVGYYREIWEECALEPVEAEDVPATWLIFDNGTKAAHELGTALTTAGIIHVQVGMADTYGNETPGKFTIRPDQSADYEALLNTVFEDIGEAETIGIAHCWSLGGPRSSSEPTSTDLMEAQTKGANSLLLLAQALANREGASARLYTITSGAAIVDDVDTSPKPGLLAHAAMNGLARTVASELKTVPASSIDLDGTQSAKSISAMVSEILSDTSESDVAIRGGRRFVRRVLPVPAADLPARTVPFQGADGEQPFQVSMDTPGLLDNLKIVETENPKPGRGEISVKVQAVGLNFRDIMAATGLLPPGAETGNSWEALGLECAGEVTAVGAGVKRLKAGDRVMATARGCLRSEVITSVNAAYKIPSGIDYTGAATIPSVFMTAYYSLITLGRLKKGERVLIHTATGGVGLAAVQIAQMVGAEIFATAGSPKKRAYLKKLGIKHVMDSRSLDFADQVLAATDGEGVDAVLNALAGPAIEKGVSVLRPFGRFLEIGKRDVYENSPIGLKALRKNITFHVIDLANVSAHRASDIAEVFDDLLGLFKNGKLKPLPADIFPVSKIADAFRHMSRARHIGKVVVTLDEPDLQVEQKPDGDIRFRKDSSYLITGGAGGFGLALADWMAENGAGQIYLMSRSGPRTKSALKTVEAIKAKGARVSVVKADVSIPEQVDQAIAKIGKGAKPLRGIIHGAMVLDDGFITQLNISRMEKVLAPKVKGAWNLHRATLDMPLDFFMSMSSMASIFGSAGQGNYVAANSYLDVFAQYRRSLGLPGQTVNWGALGGVGAVARSKTLQRYMEGMGVPAVPLAESLNATGLLLRKNVPTVAFFNVDWPTLLRTNADLGKSPRFEPIVSTVAQGTRQGSKVRTEILNASGASRMSVLVDYLKEQVASVLKSDAAKIDPERPLGEMGLDSLTSFELKNQIEGDLAIDLPVTKFLQKPTIDGLSEAVMERLESSTEATSDETGDTIEDYPLSEQQYAFWNIWKKQKEVKGALSVLNVNLSLGIKPQIDAKRLRDAFEHMVAKYPILRTRFPEANGEPRGHVDPRHATGLQIEDTTGLSEGEFARLLGQRTDEQPDLEQGPLFQIQVFHRPEDTDIVLFKMNHMIGDGWSMQLIAQEFFVRYFGLNVTEDEEQDAAADYRDFVQWEKSYLASPEGRERVEALATSYEGTGDIIRLPASNQRHPGPPNPTAIFPVELGKKTSREIDRFAKSAGVTSYAVLMAAFKAHVYRESGETDIPVAATAANRGRRQFRNTIGWLNNIIVIRSLLARKRDFVAFAKEVDANLRDAVASDDIPFLTAARVARDRGHPAAKDFLERGEVTGRLRQFSFAMRRPENVDDLGFAALLHEPGKRIQFGEMEVWALPTALPGSPVDIGIIIQEHEGKWFGEARFDPQNYDEAKMRAFIRGYRETLQQLLTSPKEAIAELFEPTMSLAPAAE